MTARPLRTCVLITGERFQGELLRADQSAVEFRWHGHTRFRVPTAAVAAIENPPGVVDVLDVPEWTDESRSFAITPVTDGIAQLWWQGDGESADDVVRWNLRFGDSVLEVTWSHDGSPALTLPADWTTSFRQHLRLATTIPAPSPPSAGERGPSEEPVRSVAARICVAVRWTETTWDVRIGPALWRQGTKPAGALSHSTLFTERHATPSVSDLTVRRFDAEQRLSRIELTDSDAVVRADGDVWYGEFLRTTGDGVELRGQNHAVALVPWTEFAAIRFQRRIGANDLLQPVTGRVREHVGPSLWEPWRLERERWMAAEVSPWLVFLPAPSPPSSGERVGVRGRALPSVSEDNASREHPAERSTPSPYPSPPKTGERGPSGNAFLDGFIAPVIEHPLLGRIALRTGDVARRFDDFLPTWQWLHPQAVHLGNNVQPEFVVPMPVGTSLGGTLTLSRQPSHAAISLDAVGLEPCGPGTPSTQPFLTELQSGALRTELFINGEPVGDWNSRLTYRPRPGFPARLRLSIPRERLRQGENTWEIRQQPARYDATEFDDCELSRIVFEAN